MGKIFGSRRGMPLLPLSVQWIIFALSALVSLFAFSSVLRGTADSYPHEHLRFATLCAGVMLMAAAGLVRRNRGIHVALYAVGGVCLLLAALLRYT
jgi:hypothetical protein